MDPFKSGKLLKENGSKSEEDILGPDNFHNAMATFGTQLKRHGSYESPGPDVL